MTGPHAARLIVALAGVFVLAAPIAARGASCEQHPDRAPAPPDRGAVLWSNQGPGTFNTLVLGPNDQGADDECPLPFADLWAISVSPGAALVFFGDDSEERGRTLVSPWGVVNVPAGSAAISVAGDQGRHLELDRAEKGVHGRSGFLAEHLRNVPSVRPVQRPGGAAGQPRDQPQHRRVLGRRDRRRAGQREFLGQRRGLRLQRLRPQRLHVPRLPPRRHLQQRHRHAHHLFR